MSILPKLASSSFLQIRYKQLICKLAVSIFLLGNVIPALAEDASQKADIRLLIDISGSMKKNDPANLRIPAVSLLTELIPDGDKAGVWTFGQWVNNLVKHQNVDDAWRKYAKQEAKKINSVALFTNIGGVLEKASDDFYKNEADFSNTHFILLTDGMVDIDRDPQKNALERERILTDVVKKIKDKGGKIHAVSLSRNADQSLMEKLAIQTGGHAAIAESPEQLTKVFLQALDQAVPSEQVPISGNEFAIDSSIEEFTALIFRKAESAPTQIISPDQTSYSYGKSQQDVKWYQDQGYDLITISRPLEGTWTIKADLEPESRVTVVSNLQLSMSKLPANFFAGEHLDVEVSFIEEGKRVQNPDFLSLLDVQLQITTEEGKSASKSMSEANQTPADGIFRESITKLTNIGRYEVGVLVDGKTFQRSKKQVVNLRAPFDFEFSAKTDKPIPYYELVVTPLNDSLLMDETSIIVKTSYPDDTSLISALELDKEKRKWYFQIAPDKGDGVYEVAVKVKSQTRSDKDFQFKPQPFEAEFPIPVGASNRIVSMNQADPETEQEQTLISPEQTPVEEQPVAEEPPVTAPEVQTEEAPVEEGSEESDSLLWIIIAAVLGGLTAIAAGLFFFLKKRKASTDEPGEILSDEDIKDIDGGKDNVVPVVTETFDEPAAEEPVIEEPLVETVDDSEEIDEDLDFQETEALPDEDESVPVLTEEDQEAIDLSADDIVESLEELAEEPEPEVDAVEELDDIAELAEAIEDAADEAEEPLPPEVEKALDINDDDDDEEEFNLEDFDIGDTDDLPDPDEKP